MPNQQRDLLGLRVCWLLTVTQPSLYPIVEDSATSIEAVLDDAVDCKILVAPLP